MKKVLIIVDVQNDFCPGGSLAVTDGDKIIPVINKIQEKFDVVVVTQDWHPEGHISFASTHGKPPFYALTDKKSRVISVLWPDHCVRGTKGAELHPDLNVDKANLIIRKGTSIDVDSYSGLFDNGNQKTGLADYLHGIRAGKVYVCGLAADYCVNFTAEDSISEGFRTYIIEDATKPVDPENYESGVKPRLEYNGCKFISSDKL